MSEGDWRRMLLDGDGDGEGDADGAGPAAPRGAPSAPLGLTDPDADTAVDDEPPLRASERRVTRLRDHGRGIRLNLVPMIDVVFQLLVFFVVTAQTLENERIFRIDVPPMEARMASGEPPRTHDPGAPLELREPPLRVRLRSSPAGPVVSVEPPLPGVDSIESLERVMQAQRRVGAAGLFAADHPIEIDPDAECSWDHVVGAFNALMRAGYRKVGIAGALDHGRGPSS